MRSRPDTVGAGVAKLVAQHHALAKRPSSHHLAMSAWTAGFFAIPIGDDGVCGEPISCVKVLAKLQELSEVVD
jgi:hypothetical protein